LFNNKTLNNLGNNRFYLFLSKYPYSQLNDSLDTILRFQEQSDNNLSFFYKNLVDRRGKIKKGFSKDLFSNSFVLGNNPFLSNWNQRRVLSTWGIKLDYEGRKDFLFALPRPFFRSVLRNLSFSNLTLKKFYKKNNFNFYQPKLFLKHQILSGEFRSINFFDQFLLNYFPAANRSNTSPRTKNRASKRFPLFFYSFFSKRRKKSYYGDLSDRMKVSIFKTGKVRSNLLSLKNKVGDKLQNNMSKSLTSPDDGTTLLSPAAKRRKLGGRRNFHFSYLINKGFDFFEFFRDFWI